MNIILKITKTIFTRVHQYLVTTIPAAVKDIFVRGYDSSLTFSRRNFIPVLLFFQKHSFSTLISNLIRNIIQGISKKATTFFPLLPNVLVLRYYTFSNGNTPLPLPQYQVYVLFTLLILLVYSSQSVLSTCLTFFT